MTSTSPALEGVESRLAFRLQENFLRLRREFRRGGFEGTFEAYLHPWPELDNRADFYGYDKSEPGAVEHKITYRTATQNLLDLVNYLDRNRGPWVEANAIAVLQIRSMIFESLDQYLAVPPDLGEYMCRQAAELRERILDGSAGRFADGLCLPKSAARKYEFTKSRVLKAQIIAALCGVNYLYRAHKPEDYELALQTVCDIEKYVRESLPAQYKYPRPSYGLIGMTTFLKGRLLSAKGAYEGNGAREAFAESSAAYMARLDQKSEFFEKGYITSEQFDDKRRGAIRRSAILAAAGTGYLLYSAAHISEAMATLSASRAVLKHNVGAVHEAFIDTLFFACRCAVADNVESLDEVIDGLANCSSKLKQTVPDTHYYFRAELERASALHARAKLHFRARDEVAGDADHGQAIRALDSVINFAEQILGEHPRNPRLLTEALILRSFVRRWLRLDSADARQAMLANALGDAMRANTVTTGNSRTKCDALIALGAAHIHFHRFGPEGGKGIRESKDLEKARACLLEALAINKGSVDRIQGLCYLYLTEAYLIDPSGVVLADDAYKKWTAIKDRVEFAYCHELAARIGDRLRPDGPLLIVNAETDLSYPVWEAKLLRHLLNTMLRNLAEETKNDELDLSKLRGRIVEALISDLKFKRSKAYALVADKELDLVQGLQELRQ
jgi:hypothetical protein